jgi:hypothetical protein
VREVARKVSQQLREQEISAREKQNLDRWERESSYKGGENKVRSREGI